MEVIQQLFDLFIHLDKHLNEIITEYGTWTYLILFLIIFCETAFVVTPFLPGDSLLFAAGTFAALGALDPVWLCVLLIIAAIAGDAVNYSIGHFIGPRAFTSNSRFLKKEHLQRTHEFYEKHGGKTIIIARFIPIIRTFAPFVAGIGEMTYRKFATFNVVGGVLWVISFTLAGFYFGNLPAVKENFTFVIVAIIIISTLPGVIEFVRAKLRKRAQSEPAGPVLEK
jgi:membrane-associated protein